MAPAIDRLLSLVSLHHSLALMSLNFMTYHNFSLLVYIGFDTICGSWNVFLTDKGEDLPSKLLAQGPLLTEESSCTERSSCASSIQCGRGGLHSYSFWGEQSSSGLLLSHDKPVSLKTCGETFYDDPALWLGWGQWLTLIIFRDGEQSHNSLCVEIHIHQIV